MKKQKNENKTKYQFTNEELWEARTTASDFLYQLIKNFRKMNKSGYPAGLTPEKWEKVLRKMEWSFKQIKTDFTKEPKLQNFNTKEEYEKANIKYQKKINKGLKLFKQYLNTLWD